MQWSKTFLRKEAAASKVMDFVPHKIEMGTPAQALDYLQRKAGSDFRMSDPVQVQTGVDKIEKTSEDEKVEQRALQMLAEIQERAYQEAYQLGLDEGTKRAFTELSERIGSGLSELQTLLEGISTIKGELVQQNEAHLVQMTYHMASRLAMSHLQEHHEALVEVMRQATSLAQDEENVRVQVNPAQIEFLEEIRKQNGREFEFLKKIRIEPNPQIQVGGCIVETNYGEVDSRIEQRLASMWSALVENMPRVKDQVSG